MRIEIFFLGFFIVGCSTVLRPEDPSQSKAPIAHETPTSSVPANPNRGTDIGSGGDHLNLRRQAAWFLGEEKTIDTCLETSSTFPVAKTRLVEVTQWAFNNWASYYKLKFPNSQRKGFAHNLRFTVSCNGTEDLRLLFGVETPEIKTEIEHLNNPMSIALRTFYDKVKGWGKGQIWISAPKKYFSDDWDTFIPQIPYEIDWTEPNTLEAAMLHEVGHIFGIGHIAGTIMDENLTQRVVESFYGDFSSRFRGSYQIPYFKQIDDTLELAICHSCEQERIEGFLGEGYQRGTDRSKNFEGILADTLPNSATRASLMLAPSQEENKTSHSALLIQINNQEIRLPLFLRGAQPLSIQPSPIFSQWLATNVVDSEWTSFSNQFGVIITQSGREIPILLGRNISYSTPLMLYRLDKGRPQVLFSAKSSWDFTLGWE